MLTLAWQITITEQLNPRRTALTFFSSWLKLCKYLPSNYAATAEDYLLEIEKLQADIRTYLSCVQDPIETA
jgi:hypothetical protein